MNNALHSSELKPLRILIVVNLHWDSRLGAVRVYAELAEQWRAAGHQVEKFTLDEAFSPAPASGSTFALRLISFPRKAAAFLREHGHRFDVVDALIGSVPFTKNELGFAGLLVARSVGLYRLYDRFEREAHQRWPKRKRGKLLGKVFYTYVRRFLSRASDAAVRHADLINVPNQEESDYLRRELRPAAAVIMQPYGLTEERRDALQRAAATPEVRLARKKIVFIGMWAPRKGLHDWPKIVRAVWQEIPEARFAFLGTMVNEKKVLSDLDLAEADRIEHVPEYEPDQLPALLRDGAVGAFPSYVEGFGLAVLEQLAAGIPTVAFDVTGPRDMLQGELRRLRVTSADTQGFARALCEVLKLDPQQYRTLSEASAATAKAYNWESIARDTLEEYRRRLGRNSGPILFVQPFSLGAGGGGGGRILRALLEQSPVSWRSVCTTPMRPPRWLNEIHLPNRPSWGRLERTRYSWLPKRTTPLFVPIFRRRLKALCQRLKASAIHTVPHAGLDFLHAQTVARDLDLPFVISVHDDLAYTAVDVVGAETREPAMRDAWQRADARFVISHALGAEYSRRYGEKPYEIVTDGLKTLQPPRVNLSGGTFRIYFMGLFHLAYERNLRALLEGLNIFEREHPGQTVTLTFRCEHIRPHVWKRIRQVTVLPYADEAQIARDMEAADLLYMPMPFGADYENFARYSVSTKMVTYVGSGLPIIYHGPQTSAAFELLQQNKAAIFFNTVEPAEIARLFAGINENTGREVVTRALQLARRDFMLEDQTRRFWRGIEACLVKK